MENLADDGDDMAQHFLGRFVYLEKDIKYAHELLEKSAAKGNFLAENDLGVMYPEIRRACNYAGGLTRLIP